MKYRTLGKTGLQVAEVGCGTWQLANDPGCWVGADPKESLQSLHRYVELGGNFIDTAWIYGYNDAVPDRHPSEELIGHFLKESGKRDSLILATKVPPKDMNWPCHKGTPIQEVFPNEWIEKCVDDSLKSLGVDVLDLVQFHVWQDDFASEDDWKQIIQNITQSGKVKHWGISINDYQPSNSLKTLDTGLIETIQFIFNIFHQKPTEKLLPYAREHNIGLIARVPLDEGGLTGNISTQTVFDTGDFRAEYFTPERLEELDTRVTALKQLMGNESQTTPELALRYILSFDAVSTVIPGMRRVKNVEANVSVSDGRKLSDTLLQELKKHAWERNFYPQRMQDPALAHSDFIEQ
jgi:aryl-alcohol dehydrogenase-like predicted oxidoreductase